MSNLDRQKPGLKTKTNKGESISNNRSSALRKNIGAALIGVAALTATAEAKADTYGPSTPWAPGQEAGNSVPTGGLINASEGFLLWSTSRLQDGIGVNNPGLHSLIGIKYTLNGNDKVFGEPKFLTTTDSDPINNSTMQLRTAFGRTNWCESGRIVYHSGDDNRSHLWSAYIDDTKDPMEVWGKEKLPTTINQGFASSSSPTLNSDCSLMLWADNFNDGVGGDMDLQWTVPGDWTRHNIEGVQSVHGEISPSFCGPSSAPDSKLCFYRMCLSSDINCTSTNFGEGDAYQGDVVFDGSTLTVTNVINMTPTVFDGNGPGNEGSVYVHRNADGTSEMYYDREESNGNKIYVAPLQQTPPTCPNGSIDSGEVCDGANLNGESCQTQGFDNGDLGCANDCKSFDTSNCYNDQIDGGTGGAAGASGSGGAGGAAGSAGMGGMAGSPDGGTGGMAGEAGSAGMGGSAGAEQDGGPDANIDCGSITAEGACSIECDGMGKLTGKLTENDKDCVVTIQDDCWMTLKVNSAALEHLYGDDIPANYNEFSYDSNTNLITVVPGTERDIMDEGGCFLGAHGGGVFTGFVGTHPIAYYEDGLNGLLTIRETSGQIALYTDTSKTTRVFLTNSDGSSLDQNRTCLNNTTCQDNELAAGQEGYVDEQDPLTEQEIPDAGGDVFDPFADAGADSGTDTGTDTPPVNKAAESGDSGGCAVCTATPGNSPETPSGVALIIAAAAAAIVARRRNGFIGLESRD